MTDQEQREMSRLRSVIEERNRELDKLKRQLAVVLQEVHWMRADTGGFTSKLEFIEHSLGGADDGSEAE